MRWVTFFPNFEQVHLTKDVGLIPYYIGLAGHDASLVGHSAFPLDIPAEVCTLKVELLPDRGSIFFLDKAFLNWLKKNAIHIDVLHLFHLSRDTIFYGWYFIKCNPKGKLYLKMDAYNGHLHSRKIYASNPLKNYFLLQLQKRFFSGLNYVSVENNEGVRLASKTYPELATKIGYLPNGVNDKYLENTVDASSKRESIVLSVGRLGSSDKNYELFLDASEKLLDLPCRFIIVGSMTETFRSQIDSFFESHPKAKEKITFLGNISDRQKLYDLFAKADVFFLPSRVESFGIAFVEALYFGACLVGHQGMYAYNDISSKGKYGTFYEDNNAESFAHAIESALSKSEENGFREEVKNHARNNFVWSKLTQELLTKLGHG